MSIYVRPVREQIEHDRIIRHLHSKLKRKYDVTMNVGAEQMVASVKAGGQVLYPDLVLTANDRGRKVAGVVEVETGESVHHLEAMAQWAPFGRLKIPFHLYVPAASADIARRLAADLGAHITELWTYHAIGDQIRLTLVQKSAMPSEGRSRASAEKRDARPARAAKPVKKAKAAKPAAKKAKPAVAKKAAKGKTAGKAAKGKSGGPARKPAARSGQKKPARAASRRR